MGRSLGAALFLCTTAAGAADAERLEVIAADGVALAELALPDSGEWCLSWQHSVTGGDVRDCFATRDGQLILARSYLHDAAAGLGHVPGRGKQHSAVGGGYWIEGIDEPVPGNALTLRVGGPSVGHTVRTQDAVIDLTAFAADTRVTLRLLTPR